MMGLRLRRVSDSQTIFLCPVPLCAISRKLREQQRLNGGRYGPRITGELRPLIRPTWLNDSRRFIFGFGNQLILLDIHTGSKKSLLVGPRGTNLGHFEPSGDDRTIFCQQSSNESDIWLMEMK
jgi:hypothetical protein